MARRRAAARRYPMVLAVICAILAGLLVVQLTTEPGDGDVASRPVVEARSREPEQAAEAQLRFDMPPLEVYSEVSERPLFLRSRRPAPPATPDIDDSPVASTPAIFVLSGVVLTDTQRLALLQGRNSPQVARVEEGEQYEGWTVESIHPNRVVLRRGQEVSEIVLEDKANVALPRDRRRTVQRGPSNAPAADETKREDKKND